MEKISIGRRKRIYMSSMEEARSKENKWNKNKVKENNQE
jgi:hypothetical protein